MTRRYGFPGPLAAAALLLTPARAWASGGGHGFTFAEQGLFIIDFLVLMVLAVVFLRKKIKAALVARAEGIRQSMDEASAAYDAADRSASEKDQRLAKLEQDREAMLTRFREEAELEAQRIVEEAQDKARRLVAEAKRQAEAERRQIQEGWRRELLDGAFDEARSALDTRLDRAARQRLTDEAIAGLESVSF